MTQSHTGEYIASLLYDIHQQFGIEETVVRTTTDNAANFCASFKNFGKPPMRIEAVAVDDDIQESDMEEMSQQPGRASIFKFQVDDAVAEGDGLVPEPLLECLVPEQGFKDGQYSLPSHARCAAHTLNLIGGEDVNKQKHKYHPIYTSALDKVTSIWTYHSHSDKFRMTVKKVSKFFNVKPKFSAHLKAIMYIHSLSTTANRRPIRLNFVSPAIHHLFIFCEYNHQNKNHI
jgi:hypothetical protein